MDYFWTICDFADCNLIGITKLRLKMVRDSLKTASGKEYDELATLETELTNRLERIERIGAPRKPLKIPTSSKGGKRKTGKKGRRANSKTKNKHTRKRQRK